MLLGVLVVGMLVTLVYLAARYEASVAQGNVERDAADALSDMRSALTRNVQELQALQSVQHDPAAWRTEAEALLRRHREWVRIEWRGPNLELIAEADTPFRKPVFERLGRANSLTEVQQACASARRLSSHSYARSHFEPQADGLGLELMELCLPQVEVGRLKGFVVATYSLVDLLATQIGPQMGRSQEISFTEADGTRLAMHGLARRGTRVFSATQLLDLPGNTMVLRMDSWRRSEPDLFPNVLTALVTVMSIALVTVLFLLGHDTRRRLRVEEDLADALAFRKAMEDSLVTGLRARDLQGRTTYVNPAFCQMVGFSPEELLGRGSPAPYWPPERAEEYGKRQAVRLTGGSRPPREGFESVFMRKDGTRFPVLIIEAPLINAQGLQTGWMSAVLDISEQRRVEELSRASQERLQATARLATVGEMASLLSHELNQPLAAIASYANGSMNLLQHAPAPAPDLQVAMRRIAEQADRAGRVIKSVHDFVRRRDQARQPVGADALVEAVLPLVNLQARKLGVRVEIRVPVGLPRVVCDRTMVEQVLLNLARNAMQAMDEARVPQPELVVQVRPTSATESGKRWLEFSVADCGPGIPEEVKRQLFTPFFTTKEEGMGLGLSLCRTVVEQHGGQLVFEPIHPRGTIFRFTLPVQEP
ncbi:PAS domain S-box protein [Ramlibacter sp. USB13]|uniref:histidine kinase n=1 Tax=Ramlibacter cellulosilyticus TaxID=2764187 RepID=A0A923MQ49_9BURK|nr:ATP-binding protein [Ramlibacter cellulosilyticus]MBC5782821.1 PAS domain S-box protein [Ramlibacter cellulosilyticus]